MDRAFRRLIVALLVVPATFLLVVACGDDDDGDGGKSGKSGGEITVHALEFQSFDPHFSSFAQDFMQEKQVFRGLYNLNQDNVPAPEMALAAPQVSADGLKYTIKLKDGLKWSDGQALTAKDFVLGFQRTCSFKIAGGYQSLVSNVAGCEDYASEKNEGKSEQELAALRDAVGVKSPDDKTVEITLKQAQPTFLTILTMPPTYPVPSHVVTSAEAEWPAPTALPFNGPFKVESYAAGDKIVFVRNDSYAGKHLAYLDRMTFRYIDNAGTANNAYRNNELVMAVADLSAFESLKGEFPEELLVSRAGTSRGLRMQLKTKPLDNLSVRLALSRAIDRETLTRVALQNAAVPSTSWVPADIAGIEPDEFDKEIGFDPEAARKDLADAGYADGKGFPTLTFLTGDSPAARNIAEFIQSHFKEVLNIDIKVEIVDAPTGSRRYTEGDFAFLVNGWNQDYPDPENWIIGQFETGGALNFPNCSMKEIDDLVAKAKFNTNDTERRQQYREINKLVVLNVCGVAPMYHRANIYLVKPQVGGAREFSNSNDYILPGDWIAEEWYLKK